MQVNETLAAIDIVGHQEPQQIADRGARAAHRLGRLHRIAVGELLDQDRQHRRDDAER